MVIEELTLFPAAEKSLSGEDWNEIESSGAYGQVDPLFDGTVEERFDQLYQVITTEASAVRLEEPVEQGA